MNGPQTTPSAVSSSTAAAATAIATAKVQRIDLWRQEVAVALSTPSTQTSKKSSRKKRAAGENGKDAGGSTFPPSASASASASSSSSPPEQARAPKRTSFLSRLLRSKGLIGRAGTADGSGSGSGSGGFGIGGGADGHEVLGNRSLVKTYPFESTAMYRSIVVPLPSTPPRGRLEMLGTPRTPAMKKGGGKDRRNTGDYDGEGEEGSMVIADLNSISSSSSSPEAGLLARQERLERAARLLGKSGGREGKG